MMQTQEILFGVTGQSFHFDAPEASTTGISSITSVSVFENDTGDDGAAESATTGSASEDAVDTTVLSASGAGQSNPRRIALSGITGVTVGRTYLMINSTGERESVEVVDIDTTGLIVLARHPLQNAYALGDTFIGTRIRISVNSTWVADTANISPWLDPNPRYRIRWVYVVGGVTYAHASYVDLVRYKGETTVLGADVDARFPGWLDSLPTYDREDQGRRLINEAYRQLKLDLYQQLKADQMSRNGEVIDELVILKAALISKEAAAVNGNASLDAVAMLEKMYGVRIQSLIANTKIPFATDQGGSGSRVPGLPAWRR